MRLLTNCRRFSPANHQVSAMPDGRYTHQATLGCGTFILIALIVLIFSKPGISDLGRDV
jgi:hypothetical protein